MEESELQSSQYTGINKPNSFSTPGIDESGIVEDISFSGKMDNSVSDSDTPLKSVASITSKTDSSHSDSNLSIGGLRKDDSGIYSEKSPSSCLTKEISDEDLSESLDGTCANGDKGTNGSVMFDLSIEGDEGSGVDSNKSEVCKSSSDMKVNDIELMKDACENNDTRSFEKMDLAESIVNNVSQTESRKSENACNSLNCDIENNCNKSEDEDFDKFVRKTVKSRSHVKQLVDYDSDSDNNSDKHVSVGARGSRRYRKRKPDLDSDDDNDDEDVVDQNSSSPILLRHSPIDENNIHNNNDDSSDISSDSSDDSHLSTNAKRESSDSEPDDVPPTVSQYGPPKHKWRAVTDLRCREFGMSTTKDPGFFRKKVQGSLQMVQRFQLQFKMNHHEGCVNALHFNSIGTLLASGSDDLNIVIWNWIHNRPALIYDSGHRSNVFQAKFMPFSGDCHVVSCARDGQVRLADLSSTGICKATKKIAQHKGAAHKLALEMDSAHVLLSAGEDAVTYEIDLRQDKANRIVTTKEKDKKVSIYSIHSNPVNSNEFCLGGRDHFIRVYDKRKINEEVNDGLLKRYAPHHIVDTDKDNIKANVTCACYNYNGTEILGTYNDEDIYLFNNLHSDNADYIHRYRGHRNNQTVKGVNFYGPESEFIVSGSDCGHIFLWDKPTENIVQFMEGDEGGVINVLEPHPFAPVLATSGLDHDVKIWAPTAENPTNLKGLKKLMKRNAREREEERSGEGGMIDGSMLWFIMHHLRRGRRQRAREAARAARGEQVPDMDSSDTLSDDTPRDAISCAPS